jgi:glycosyltransferase involved in cell wall biosynthesis
VPLVSIVIPVFNGELTIKETVTSVLNQTFLDFELIIINDGSSDSTLDVLAEFKDTRVKIFTYTNSGLSASRNRGIDHALGEYISFLDADDLWTADKLEAQLNALQEYPEAAVAYSWTDFIDERGNMLGIGIHYTVNGYVYPKLLEFFFIGSGSNALIRKQVFDEVGRFDETLTSAEDMDIFLRLASRYQFSAVPAPQILYRVTDNSMSRNVIRQERETLKVIDRAFSQEPGKSLGHLKKSVYANLYGYLASHTLRGAPDKRRVPIAARFIWRTFINDPLTLKRGKLIGILIFKLVTTILLPPQQARSLRATMKSRLGH